MAKLAEAFVEIGSKTTGLDAGLSRAEKSLMGFVASAQQTMGALGTALGTGGMVTFLANAANKAADLDESLNKVKVTFGDASGVITGLADQMATQFGIVKQSVLDAASNIGLILQGAGVGADKAAGLSAQLVKLADDASSFYNVGLDTALEKIRSGLVGEAEPLRAFGVMLSETAVKAEALRMGVVPLNGELTEQEKVMARVELITKGLNKAQGDHLRTLDSYTNQVRTLKGEWENFQTDIGKSVVPPALSVMQGRTGAKAAIGEIGPMAYLGLLVRAGFSKSAANELADVMTRGIAGDEMYQPARRPDGTLWARQTPGPPSESFEQFEKRTGTFNLFEAMKFGGGGFGAFGMMGNFGQMLNAQAMGPLLDQREREIRNRAWSGGFGAMSGMDFFRAAQESINRPVDETAKQQLAELQKIREAVTKPQPTKREGVMLRGPA